ncbi:hypothetical protein KUCAC02_003400, partial [Chaenocephalus aceratus]
FYPVRAGLEESAYQRGAAICQHRQQTAGEQVDHQSAVMSLSLQMLALLLSLSNLLAFLSLSTPSQQQREDRGSMVAVMKGVFILKSVGVCCISSPPSQHRRRNKDGLALLQALIAVIRMHGRSRCGGASPRGDSARKAPPLSRPGYKLSKVPLPSLQVFYKKERLGEVNVGGVFSKPSGECGKSGRMQQIGVALKHQPCCEGDGFSLRQSDCEPRVLQSCEADGHFPCAISSPQSAAGPPSLRP